MVSLVVLAVFVLRILSRREEESLSFYSESSSMRSGDSGFVFLQGRGDLVRNLGGFTGPGWGADKGR